METAILGFVIGTILGSFFKALADRSLANKSFWGRSQCQFCKKSLKFYDLFPIISFLQLRGKCRYCHKKLSKEYLIVEMVMGILIGFLFWYSFYNSEFSLLNPSLLLLPTFQFSIFILDLLFKTFFITILAILFLTDLKDMFIPDRIVIPAIIISFFYLLISSLYKIGYLYYYLTLTPIGQKLLPPYSDYFQRHAIITAEPLLYGVLMAVLIGGFFLSLIIITRGKGMGGGDVKLGALMGLVLGFPNALVALVLAFFAGAILSVFLIIFGKKHFGQSIPFGPFLVLGSLIVIFFGKEIVDWYLHISFS